MSCKTCSRKLRKDYMRRLTLLILPALLLLGVLPACSQAATRYNVAVAVADQSPTMFSQPAWKALKVKKTRYFIPWDAAKHPDQLAQADRYVDAARKAHVGVLMHISTNDLRAGKAKLPTVSTYKKYVGKLVKRYKAKGVKEWGAWNEANHKTQPTWRSAARAADFFKAMRGLCRGCTNVVALDVIDQAGVAGYIDRFYKRLGSYKRFARVVGIHNYSDTNRYRSRGTSTIIRQVKRYNRSTNFWLTETGGVVNFGRSFPCSQKRASKAVGYMFTLVKQFRRDVKRLYAYNWTGAGCNGFDAGLVNADGSMRPAYATFKKNAVRYTR
jgi:hypothetical protein